MKRALYFLRLLAGVVLALQAGMAAAQALALVGNVETVTYDRTHQCLQVQGWAWDAAKASPVQTFQLSVRGQGLELASFAPVERPDVAAALQISALNTGFSARFKLPAPLADGSYPIVVSAVLQDGTAVALPTGAVSPLHVQPEPTPGHHLVLLTLVVAFIAFTYLPPMRRGCHQLGGAIGRYPARVAALIAAAFLLLVGFGITGSSWQMLAQGREGVLASFDGPKQHLFDARGIRADEWGILTTNALAQWNHAPRFPKVNSHLGLEGQNMGVIGMTGVPIAQPAAWVRPATWGYFLLPLRQAMAWHWQFPFFACLFFLWRVLALLSPSRAGLNLLLATTFCVAPYAAGWSLWPLYAAFFPLAIFVAAAALLRTEKVAPALFFGCAAGMLLAGWVLVLYPPWQITVGTLMLVVALGWAMEHRQELFWTRLQAVGMCLMVVVAAAFLASWWSDTADAVAKVQATVYPGHRDVLRGADVAHGSWWALRGYLNVETLASGLGPGAQSSLLTAQVNQSELSSYVLLPLPLLLLGCWLSWGTKARPLWTLRGCMAFVVFWCAFRFIGIPLWLAKATLWSYVTSIRLDLALGLVCTFVLALLGSLWDVGDGALGQPSVRQTRFLRVIACLVALGSAALVALEFHLLPPDFLRSDSPFLRLAVSLALGAAAWWLMVGRVGRAAGMVLVLNLVATLAFNPVSQAPSKVHLSAASLAMATHGGQLLRTLVISRDAKGAVTLAAAGLPVVNGVQYYPQRALWQKMQLAPDDWNDVNRYQHLTFGLADLRNVPSTYQVRGQFDAVRVSVDPSRFDFSSTGAQRVLSSTGDADLLRHNGGLTRLGQEGDFVWFAVRGPTNQRGPT